MRLTCLTESAGQVDLSTTPPSPQSSQLLDLEINPHELLRQRLIAALQALAAAIELEKNQLHKYPQSKCRPEYHQCDLVPIRK
jgi:hypothetical protein